MVSIDSCCCADLGQSDTSVKRPHLFATIAVSLQILSLLLTNERLVSACQVFDRRRCEGPIELVLRDIALTECFFRVAQRPSFLIPF